MIVVTEGALFRLEGPGDEPQPLEGVQGATRAVEGRSLDVFALPDGRLVVLRKGKRIERATGIAEPIESLLLLGESPLDLMLGTEGAHLFRLRQGDAPADRIGAFDALECRKRWHTPWGGPPAVRSLAATRDGWVYADIHVGSIMCSPDRGRTWRPVAPDLDEDVHQVATTPASDARVYANTARSVYISEDRGASWRDCGRDLRHRYGRAIAVDPRDPDLILASVSDGPHGDDVRAQLYRSDDGGRRWRHVAGPFPASCRANINTSHVVFSEDGTAWAAAERDLYLGRERATRWERVWTAPAPVEMLSCRPPE